MAAVIDRITKRYFRMIVFVNTVSDVLSCVCTDMTAVVDAVKQIDS